MGAPYIYDISHLRVKSDVLVVSAYLYDSVTSQDDYSYIPMRCRKYRVFKGKGNPCRRVYISKI
jgi:hypothetical protein